MNYRRTKYACYFGYISSAIINNFAPLLYVTFMTTFKFSATMIGFLIAINFAVQMSVDFLGARYAEKIGYKRMICTGCLLCCVGLVLLGLLSYVLPPYIAVMLATVVYAIGGGIIEVLVSPIVEAIPGDNKASMMSMLHSFYAWGQLLVVVLSTVFFIVFSTVHWRLLSIIWGIVPFSAFIMFINAPVSVFAEGEERLPFRKLFTSRIFIILMMLMFTAGASELAVAQWASAYAEKGLNVSKTMGDLLGTSMFALCMGIARIIYGLAGNKLNLKKYMFFCGILCILGYLIVTFVPFEIIALLGCGLVGFSVGIMWPGTLSIAAKDFPQGGTAIFGILAMAGDIGCMTGPGVVAFVAEYFTLNGSDLKAGMAASIIFPLLFTIFTKLTKKIPKTP